MLNAVDYKSLNLSMNDAERYQAEFEQLMRDTEARAEAGRSRDRDAIWKEFEQSFTRMADALKWSAEKRASYKKNVLDHILSDDL